MWLRYLLWNWPAMNATRPYRWLAEVMAWCWPATSHYLSQYWPSSMSPNGVTRPQWVKWIWCSFACLSYWLDTLIYLKKCDPNLARFSAILFSAIMMLSSNGKPFLVTAPVWGEFTSMLFSQSFWPPFDVLSACIIHICGIIMFQIAPQLT